MLIIFASISLCMEVSIIMDLLIQKTRLINPSTQTDAIKDILIEDGIITAIDDNIPLPHEHFPTINARNLTTFPGLTDIHCHFRDPGWPEKETIESGAQAALAGGVTTVVCMANTNPVVDNIETLDYILEKSKNIPINLLQNSAMTKGLKGNELVDVNAMLSHGACGFSDDGIPISNPQQMIAALKAVHETNSLLSVHEELPQLLFSAGVNYGPISKRLGVGGASDICEAAMVERDLQLQKMFGGRLHFQHISSARSYELIRKAKLKGQAVTAEVTPQHLALTEEILFSTGTNSKINPPIRSKNDQEALIEGIIDGTFDVIATDHAPHTTAEKSKSIFDAPSGMIGLETSLSIAFHTLVSTNRISRIRLAELMCCNGAKMYGLEKKIEVGQKADLTLFNETYTWTPTVFHSKSENTPFKGRTRNGKVMYTVCNNQLFNYIYDNLKEQ